MPIHSWVILIAVILVTVIVLGCNLAIEWYALKRVYEDLEELPEKGFCLVLGTGPTRKDGQPNRFFVRRIHTAAELFKRGKVRRFILSGDRHDDYDEPAAMRDALVATGVPANICHLDGNGYDTIDSILNARNVFGADTLTIVSQDSHCERAVFIAGCLGIKAIAYVTEDVEPI